MRGFSECISSLKKILNWPNSKNNWNILRAASEFHDLVLTDHSWKMCWAIGRKGFSDSQGLSYINYFEGRAKRSKGLYYAETYKKQVRKG